MPAICLPALKLKSLCLIVFIVSACGGGSTVSGPAGSGNASALVAEDAVQAPSASESAALSGEAIVNPIEQPAMPAGAAVTPDEQGDLTVEVVVTPIEQSPSAAVVLPADETSSAEPVRPAVTEEQQPAVAAPREYTVADITDLILVTGQSNALGADTAYDANADSPHQRVFAFTENGWARADLHQVWDLGWFPRGNPGADPSNNFAFHAAKELAYRSPERVVGFVLASAPGEGIDYWDSGESFFAEINQKVLAALNEVPHKSGFDGIMWHQGESDEGDHDYNRKLDQLISDFRQQNWFAADRAFICGETAQFEVVNRQLMALNDNGDRWTGCVDGGGLQTREDGFHFSAEGLRELGRRYSIKYLSMTAQ